MNEATIGNFVEFLVLLFYVAIKFVLPGAFLGWALLRGGRWIYERGRR